MLEPKIRNYDNVKVKVLPETGQFVDLNFKMAMRKDFYENFATAFKELFKETGATIFTHTVIENYWEPYYKLSAFGSNEEWHELYWEKYYDQDQTEQTCHRSAQRNGVGVTSWQVIDPTSDCMAARMSIGKVKDGVMIAFKHPNGLLENMSFGWQKFNTDNLTPDKLAKLNQIISPIRQHHIRTFHDYV